MSSCPPSAPFRRAVGDANSYARVAATYDDETARFAPYRRLAVDLLELARGEVVLDVGCGTGLCFPYIEQKIGDDGRIIGLDRSPEMLQRAAVRVARHGWANVTLIEAEAEAGAPGLHVPGPADAVLLSAVHDVIQSRAALESVVAHARLGATVVATGGKWAPPWLGPINVLSFLAHRPYVGSFRGFSRPWRHLEAMVPDLRVRPLMLGAGYVAWGRLLMSTRS
ncbi:MAG TPA: methyltransferase domain-containing protein [Acidimicrobiales bacterium]|jgi:demethylmenaquinone methyltransferase/2-methoxy-6-polyprenyl-1,4-benzoquinol methylase|nr:methyltransferase domain-containing protein [Acidimicrobiales bacterium]